jgi:hypothetical protein
MSLGALRYLIAATSGVDIPKIIPCQGQDVIYKTFKNLNYHFSIVTRPFIADHFLEFRLGKPDKAAILAAEDQEEARWSIIP